MLAAGIKSPAPLEELERHLRDEIEQHMKSGLPGQRAFEMAAPHIGPPELLENEFKKIEGTFMKQAAKIGLGVAGILVGAALMVPGSIQLRDELVLASGRLGLWLLGWLLSVWSLQQIILSKGFKGKPVTIEFTPVKHPMKAGAGIVVLLIGAALMLPAAAQVCAEGLIRFEALCWMIFGLALLLGGGLVAFTPYRRRAA